MLISVTGAEPFFLMQQNVNAYQVTLYSQELDHLVHFELSVFHLFNLSKNIRLYVILYIVKMVQEHILQGCCR